ncbi:hypothetical protein MMC07_005124 [Pseudocyphellaria aurata]|nr:hypothetical protein [Pseudocyphellaria aurata]
MENMADPKSNPLYCQESNGNGMLVLTWVTLSVTASIVALRLYFKCRNTNCIGWDDHLIVLSLMSAFAQAGFLTRMISLGVGRHMACISPDSRVEIRKWITFLQLVNVIGIGLAKISVCALVLRVIDKAAVKFSRFLWAIIAFVITVHLAEMIAILAQCRPLEALWNPNVKGKCSNRGLKFQVLYIENAFDAFTDLTCAAIPIYLIQRLRMNTRTKIALCCLMGLGAVTAVCAVVKSVYTKDYFSNDYTYTFRRPAVWFIMEQLIGIMLASMPALKPIFDKTFHLSQGFSKRSELRNIPISDPVVHMQLPSGSFSDERRMEQKDGWIHEISTALFDEGSMSTRKESDSSPGRDLSPV